MEVAHNGELETLMATFQKKLHRAEDGLNFLDALYYSIEGKITIKEIAAEIVDLSAMCEVIRSKIDAEKEKMKLIEMKREQLRECQSRLNHISYHLPDSVEKSVLQPKLALNAEPERKTQKLNCKENQKPSVKTSKKIKLIKLLQNGDFEKIPRHIKYHLTMEQINAGISEVNHILEKKYDFLKRPRGTLTHADEKKRSIYLEMGKDLKGTVYEIFFMDSDVQHYSTVLRMKPKTRETVFLVLRHLGKMKEVRKGKPARYCILGG